MSINKRNTFINGKQTDADMKGKARNKKMSHYCRKDSNRLYLPLTPWPCDPRSPFKPPFPPDEADEAAAAADDDPEPRSLMIVTP
ncbi:unnamed protein product [Leptidea sinapis]|uniref:Uncharacterized protein n=1 Tax=Leptidea sinapis TaxID=189913 RepID=A0A5E4PU12_9NEOP|nr:unnamed protein product [Leptidea sinapis]